jgi:hypothetical protein
MDQGLSIIGYIFMVLIVSLSIYQLFYSKMAKEMDSESLVKITRYLISVAFYPLFRGNCLFKEGMQWKFDWHRKRISVR